MILKPKHKNFNGQLQIEETVLKNLKSGAICPCLGLLNDITYFEVILNW
jgi:hypothetical protein